MEEQKQHLECVLVAQRCAGITAHVIENGCIRIRFETSYKGEEAMHHVSRFLNKFVYIMCDTFDFNSRRIF